MSSSIRSNFGLNQSIQEENSVQPSLSDRQLQTIFETALDGMAIADDRGCYLNVNSAACKLFGLERDKLLGRYIWEFVESGLDFQTTWQKLQQQEKVRGEFHFKKLDEEIRIVEYAATANFLPDCHLLVMRDITPHKQVEKLTLQLTQLQTQLQEAGIESEQGNLVNSQNHRLKQIAQHIPGVIYQFRMRSDGTFHFPYASEGLREIYGFSPEEVQDNCLKVFTVIHSEDLDRVTQSILKSAENLTPWYCEYRVCLPDGRTLWLLGHATPEREPDGSTLWHGYIRDITEQQAVLRDRKQAENMLRESEGIWRTLVDVTPAAVAMFDRQMRYLLANQAWYQQYGLENTEIIGRSHYEIFPDVPQKWKDIHARCLTGISQKNDADFWLRADGNSDWVRWEIRPWIDRQGEIGGLLMYTEVITDRKQAEAKLIEITQLQQAVLDGANYTIISTDPNGIIKTFNAAAERLLGYSSAEVVDKVTPAILHDLEEVKQRATALSIELGQPIEPGFEVFVAKARLGIADEHEWSYIHKDGSRFPVLLSVTPLRDREGTITGFLGIANDITERKQAEVELKEVSERLSFALKSGKMGCWEWDIIQNTLDWDDRMYELYGVTKESDARLVYDIWATGLHPDDREITETIIRQAVLGEAEYDPEFRVVHPDGSVHFIKAFGLVRRDAQGNALKMIGVNFDISDRKRQEQALRLIVEGTAAKTGEAFFQTCVQYLAQVLEVRYAFIAVFVDSEKLVANTLAFWAGDDFGDNFTYNLACSPCENVKTPDALCIYPNSVQSLFPEDNDLVTLQVESYAGLPIINGNGDRLGLLAVLDTKPMAEELTMQAAILKIFATRAGAEIERIEAEAVRQSEIKLRQKTEELEATLKQLQATQMQLIQAEKMSSLGQLVAGIAHEINNPVSFIYSNIQFATDYATDLVNLIQLYQEHYPSPPAAISDFIKNIDFEYVNNDLSKLLLSMKTGATRIRDIVKSLRTFSRLDEADLKKIDIHENLESTLAILQNRLNDRASNSEIQVVKNYGKLPLVECYGGLLNQVFMNLLLNAIDAIEQHRESLEPTEKLAYQGQITITTSITSENQFVISIHDNGCGMSPEIQEKIFNPFFTTKPVGKGTGMGLAISYQIVTKNHPGSLRCFSTPRKGTEFRIELPICDRSKILS
ncbi:PAS domain S-box protein [Floridanema evergladense]|uniref:histidine kinase n=1 Tax=Floridaenema evergladense BLCC-F167 TaxID=3153639 RepID=A0ABV4WIA7_9CYAN